MKRIRKICSFVVALAMIVTMFSATVVVKADALTQRIWLEAPGVEEINPGDEVVVPVMISDRIGLRGASFRVTWDPTLITMSTEYNEDDNIYAGFPVVSSMFNLIARINIGEGFIMVAGGRNSAFSSGVHSFSVM